MAFMNRSELDFRDIRLVLYSEGYKIEDDFVPREIGYWSRNFNGSIPIRYRLNTKKFNEFDKKFNQNLIDYHHGINFDNKSEYALVRSDIKGIILTLYNMSKSNKYPRRKYIGVVNSINITSMLGYCGLGNLVVDLSKLIWFRDIDLCDLEKCINYYRDTFKLNPIAYNICELHSALKNYEKPMCAGAFAKMIGDYGILTEEGLEQ